MGPNFTLWEVHVGYMLDRPHFLDVDRSQRNPDWTSGNQSNSHVIKRTQRWTHVVDWNLERLSLAIEDYARNILIVTTTSGYRPFGDYSWMSWILDYLWPVALYKCIRHGNPLQALLLIPTNPELWVNNIIYTEFTRNWTTISLKLSTRAKEANSIEILLDYNR